LADLGKKTIDLIDGYAVKKGKIGVVPELWLKDRVGLLTFCGVA
jgi:hypothetical protein